MSGLENPIYDVLRILDLADLTPIFQNDANTGIAQLWSVSAEKGERVATGLNFPVIGGASLHPEGRRLTYIGRQPGQTELWVMKLLPPGAKPSGK